MGQLWQKNHKKAATHGANLARQLSLIGKHHCNALQSVPELVRNAESKLWPKKSGLTARNRAKLRTILEDKALPRLLQLPQHFMAGPRSSARSRASCGPLRTASKSPR